jgi:hypothetical protein
MPTIYVRKGAATDPQIAGTPPPGVAKIGAVGNILAINADGTVRYAVDLSSAQTITGDKTFTGTCTFTAEVTTSELYKAPHAVDFSQMVPSTETDGTLITTRALWPTFATAGQCGIKLLLEDSCATGNFASIRIRARNSVAGGVANTVAGDFSASAWVNDYKCLVGVSAYAQVPAAYTQSSASNVIAGLHAAITDYAGATSNGSRWALWVDDYSAVKATNHYLIHAAKSTGITIDGVLAVNGDKFTYGIDFNAAGFDTADFRLHHGDTINNTGSGAIAASGVWTFAGAPAANGLLYANTTSTSAAPGSVRAIVGAVTTLAGATQTSGTLAGVRGSVTAAAAITGSSIYGVQGKFITGAFSAAGTLGAVYGQFDVTGGSLGAGNIAVIHANMVGCSAGAYALNGLYVEQAGGGYINSYARMLGNSTFVFDFESSFTNMSHTCSSVTNVGTKGYLKIQVANTTGTYTRYIALGDGIT